MEVFVEGGEPPRTAAAGELPVPSEIPSTEQILADNPELAEEYPNGFVLSDLAANNPEILEQYADPESLNGWRVIPSSEAGEAQATADVVLAEAGIFGGPTEYKKLDVFSVGGKPTRERGVPRRRCALPGLVPDPHSVHDELRALRRGAGAGRHRPAHRGRRGTTPCRRSTRASR